ncbi:MAG: hypothetical protein ABIQ40_07575 [Bacteroidia bacterium]
MKKLNLLAPFFLMLILFSTCSKDKQFERALHKKEGTWNIKNVAWQKVVQGSAGQSINLGTTSNAGTFSFDKDGSGSYSFTVDGSTYSENFNWTVSDEHVSIAKVSQSFDLSGNFSQLAVAISGTQQSKNTIELAGSQTNQYSSGPVTQQVITGTFLLERK